MAKGRKRRQSGGGRSGGGMLGGMRKGFRGMVHGDGGKRRESTFWNVLFYLMAGLLGALLVYRWTR
jgi:hypothetical protein